MFYKDVRQAMMLSKHAVSRDEVLTA